MEIVKYDAMLYAIAECERVDEAKELQNKAKALEVYYRQAGNTEAERKVCDIRLRAERRVGELLRELAKSQGTRTDITSPRGGERLPVSPYGEALQANGISSQSASRYQALADVPQAVFDQALADPVNKPSTRALIEQAREPKHSMPGDSLWVWGVMRDMERDGFFAKDAAGLLAPMTPTMRRDMERLAPLVAEFFNCFLEESYESA